MSDLGDFEEYAGDEGEGEGDGEGEGTAEASTPSSTQAVPAEPSTEDGPADRNSGGMGASSGVDQRADLDRAVGTLSATAGLAIGEDDETRLRAYITVGNRSAVRIGTYLLAPYPDDERLFCRIRALEYAREFQADDATEIHARRAMQSSGIDEQDYKFMAALEPVAVLYEDGGELKRRMTDRVPKPETVVRQVADKGELKTGLKIPEAGVFLGHLSVGGERVTTMAEPPTIDYRLRDDYDRGDPLVFRHTLVAGGTGSGKTHAAKNVLRQFLTADRTYPVESGSGRQSRPAVVVFDPQDEYAQMHDDNPAASTDETRRWEREGIVYGGHDDTIAFVPKVGDSSYAASHHRAEQVEFTIPFSMVNDYDMPWLVAGASLNENQYGALLTLINRFFRQYGEDGTYQEFLTFLDDPGLRDELHESGRVHEASFDAVTRRVRGIPRGVFDQNARPITDLDTELVRPGGLSVVPTYHLPTSRTKEMVVLAVASLLIDDKLSNSPRSERIKDTPLILGMDEAHNFLADADNVQARKVVTKFTEAAKQGRKERLGLFLITQDPQDVAEPVFKQVNTKLILSLGDEDAIRSVNIPPNLENKVPYMETGQMVVHSPDNSEPVELIGLPTCVTRHGRDA